MKKSGALILAAAMLALSGGAEAKPMLATFTGQLISLDGPDRPLGSAEIGAQAVARFVFDTDITPGQDFGDRVSYGGSGPDNPVLSATITIGGTTVAFGNGEESYGGVFLGRDASLPEGMRDYFGIVRTSVARSSGAVTSSRLTARVVSSSAFVPGLDPFPTFSYSPQEGDQAAGDYEVQSQTTTPFGLLYDARGGFAWSELTITDHDVPAPAGFWLFASALLLLRLRRRSPQGA